MFKTDRVAFNHEKLNNSVATIQQCLISFYRLENIFVSMNENMAMAMKMTILGRR